MSVNPQPVDFFEDFHDGQLPSPPWLVGFASLAQPGRDHNQYCLYVFTSYPSPGSVGYGYKPALSAKDGVLTGFAFNLLGGSLPTGRLFSIHYASTQDGDGYPLTGGREYMSLRFNNDSTIGLYDGTGAIMNANPGTGNSYTEPITQNTWYWIEVSYRVFITIDLNGQYIVSIVATASLMGVNTGECGGLCYRTNIQPPQGEDTNLHIFFAGSNSVLFADFYTSSIHISTVPTYTPFYGDSKPAAGCP